MWLLVGVLDSGRFGKAECFIESPKLGVHETFDRDPRVCASLVSTCSPWFIPSLPQCYESNSVLTLLLERLYFLPTLSSKL